MDPRVQQYLAGKYNLGMDGQEQQDPASPFGLVGLRTPQEQRSEALASKYQLGLTDEEKGIMSGSEGRAANVELGQGLMEAARSVSAGIAGQAPPTKALFASNSANDSRDQVRSYILNKLNERRGAAKTDQEQTFKDRERQEDRDSKSADLQVRRDANAIANSQKNAMRDDIIHNRENNAYDKLISRREGHDITKATGARVNMYNNINDAAITGTPQSDQVMIYSFMKLLDPTSAVLPGEYKSAKDAAGLDEKVGTTLAGWKSGDLLSPKQRQGILAEAKKLYDKQIVNQKAYDNTLKAEAKLRGLDPERVIMDGYGIYSTPEAQAPQGQKPGGKTMKVTRAADLP